ncbi:MAG: cysteine hydrolase [Deltaproteobacteria bacterium]|nr:cysteine hydrolase [Deltaproteobacteria bacterium]
MYRILVDVDTQVDFCEPQGALFVSGAPAVMDRCRALVRHAGKTGIPLVGSVDSHAFNAWEFNTNITDGKPGPFPPHCVKGTAGWLKVAGTLAERAYFVPNTRHEVHPPAGWGALYFEKEVYSLFANPMAEPVLRQLAGAARERPTFTVFGVATDYCVKAACEGLLGLGVGEVELVTDAVAAVVQADGEKVLADLRGRGVRLVTTSQVTA